MQIVRAFPWRVIEEPNVWIPMPDGIHLAARIWRPRTEDPVPAIVEYIPYFKRFSTATRDATTHHYLAGHGYACIRVDIRGSGESEGLLADEYLPQEQDDGCAVLRWIADQPWCTGDVGMMGISWGGFNGLQIAAKRPPELKAVVTVSSTDDRYADDVHHMGGCLLGDNISWGSVMFAYTSLPPDPALVGDRWRDMWQERLEACNPWLRTWLRHQRRDEYWRHGSICEDFSAVQCPVYAVSGWADGYSNTVFRLMEHLDVPRKGLIGPWSHKYPHLGVPGPAIGFLQELLRWWDHWLKGRDTGVMDDPMLRVWMQDSVPPTTFYHERPGRWVAETEWPASSILFREFGLDRDRLTVPGEKPGRPRVTVQSPLTVGLFAGKWCSYAAGPDLAHDQREEDGGALVFESDPLEQDMEILGSPYAELQISTDQPVAMIAARLSDVAPDDKATRVTFGLLNLTQREDREHPSELEPGQVYRVRVQLNAVAQVFPAGHRLRLSLSTSYWPLAWPPPRPVRLTVYTEDSRFRLPVRPARAADTELRPFEEAEGAPPPRRTRLAAEHHNWLVYRDLAADRSVLEVVNDSGTYRLDGIGLTVQEKGVEYYTTVADDFASPTAEVVWERSLQRGDWHIRTVTRTVLTADPEHFYLHASLDAYEWDVGGEQRLVSRNWHERIPRDHI